MRMHVDVCPDKRASWMIAEGHVTCTSTCLARSRVSSSSARASNLPSTLRSKRTGEKDEIL